MKIGSRSQIKGISLSGINGIKQVPGSPTKIVKVKAKGNQRTKDRCCQKHSRAVIVQVQILMDVDCVLAIIWARVQMQPMVHLVKMDGTYA